MAPGPDVHSGLYSKSSQKFKYLWPIKTHYATTVLLISWRKHFFLQFLLFLCRKIFILLLFQPEIYKILSRAPGPKFSWPMRPMWGPGLTPSKASNPVDSNILFNTLFFIIIRHQVYLQFITVSNVKLIFPKKQVL